MFQTKLKNFLFVFLLVLVAVAASSCAKDSSTGPSLLTENSAPISDGGEVIPNEGGATYVCTVDESGNCIDESENTDLVNIAATGLDFGINELNLIECIGITIPGGLTYEAEIDKDNTSDVEGSYQFAVQDSSGAYSQSRVEGTGTLNICYIREAIGSHTGQIKVVVSGGTSTYAYVIPTQGETLPLVFTITSPTTGQIIDVNHNNGVDDGEGDYLITASGTVNTSLTSIFENGANAEIIIQADTVKYKTTFDTSGKFSKEIGLPQQEGRYNVTFSIETTKDGPVEKIVPVVVAGAPKLEIEVRDSTGTAINQATPTDVPDLIVGFKVTNLPASGSSETEMPVTLSGLHFNGTSLTGDKQVWYQEDTSWCQDEEGDDRIGFDAPLTFCVPLSEFAANFTDLQNGTNTITATATNTLGTASSEFILILDNTKPVLTITAPTEGTLVSTTATSILLSGTVKNYAPVDVNNLSAIPAEGDNTGSYCQPTGDGDTACPASSVKLWFNIPTLSATYPIQIFPKSANSDGQTLREFNDTIANNAATSDNCSTTINSTTLFDGDLTATTTDASGNIVTTIVNTDGTTTSSTTTTDGVVTITDSDGVQKTYQGSDDPDADLTTTVATDATTGAVTQTTTQRICNIPEGTFSITLTVPSPDSHATFNLFTNVIEFQASSVSGHNTIQVVTFEQGVKRLTRSSSETDPKIYSPWMGTTDSTCGSDGLHCVERAPVQLFVSGDILDRNSDQGKKIIPIVEKLLNDSVKFEDIATGRMFAPKDEDGNTDLEADFRTQYPYNDFRSDLSPEQKEKFIQQGLHSNSMALKYWAKLRYVEYLQDQGDEYCRQHASKCFFERNGDPVEQYDVARDACNAEITTTMLPIGDLQYTIEHFQDMQASDVLNYDEWPTVAGDNKNFDDLESGRWLIQSLTLRDGGYIDADVCVVPNDANLEDAYNTLRCDADVSNATVPAFWGHVSSHNLVEGGLTGDYDDDPTMPLIWSVGKVRLSLANVLRLKHDPVNLLDIDADEILIMDEDEATNGNMHDTDKMELTSIQIEPFNNCHSYYETQYPGYETPFGCENKNANNYPLVLERNSELGQTLYEGPMSNGKDSYLLEVMWQGVLGTFQKMVGCMDTEMLSPMLSDNFDFPVWAMSTDRIPTSFEWEGYGIETNIENADLHASNEGLTVRVPLRLSAPSNTSSSTSTGSTIVRSTDGAALEDYPTTGEGAYLSASLNLEEIANTALQFLFKKGPLSLLEMMDLDEITPSDNWTVGVDKVILNRFDICTLAGLLPSDLPKDLLFASVQSMFNEPALHLDVILDPDSPPTLAMNAIDGVPNATEIKLGVTNVQIAVKELIPYDDGDDNTTNVYNDPASQPEILRVRLDGVLRLQVIYHESEQLMNVFLPTLDQQNLHLSVPAGHGGATYNDTNIVGDLLSLLTTTFEYLAKNFDETPTAEATMSVAIAPNGTMSLVNLADTEISFNTTSAANESCNGNVALYVGETAPRTRRFPGLTLHNIEFDGLNSLEDMLADFGIDDILVTPNIIFDNANGYVHVSGTLDVEPKEE